MLQDEFPDANATYVVFTSEADDKHSRRQQHREVNAVASEVPQFMHWSERPISSSRDDHPVVMPSPGAYAMVLDSTFSTERRACRFSRVLIDGDSSINILYRDTMEKLGIKEKQLLPSRTMFHGIVPGLSCSPIGKIKIDVLFGDKTHFRREPIWFEVVDLDIPYHVLLGRPALTKLMVVPHYAYLKMKMSGPKGIITIACDYQKSLTCAVASSHPSSSPKRSASLTGRWPWLASSRPYHPTPRTRRPRSPSSRPKRPRRSPWTRHTRRDLPSWGLTSTANRKASLSIYSVRIRTSLHGLPRTCRVF